MSEPELEAMIQERGLTAPRLTPEKIDNQIKLFPAHAQDKLDEASKMIIPSLLINQQTFINIFIVLHQISQFFIGQQADAGLRIICPQGPQDRRGQHQVADMHEIDDENILIQVYLVAIYIYFF